jgi:hypothetical protein
MKTDITPASVRDWFAEQPAGKLFTMPTISAIFGVAPGDERRRLAEAVRCGYLCGFLERTETASGRAYRVSGNGMRRPTLEEGARVRRKAEARLARDDRKRRARGAPVSPNKSSRVRAARVNLRAANMPAPAAAPQQQVCETIEQFLARGGRVQRLPTHWEQMERAA